MSPQHPPIEDLASYLPEPVYGDEDRRSGGDAHHSGAKVEFNEIEYLAANPDIAEKVATGEVPSGQFHYQQHGRKEGRPLQAHSERANIDAVVCSPSGFVFVIGWAEERLSRIKLLRVVTSHATIEVPASKLVRVRRPDVESALSFEGVRHFGFCALVSAQPAPEHAFSSAHCMVVLEFESGGRVQFNSACRTVANSKLLEIVLGHLPAATFYGNPQVEMMFALDGGFGKEVIALNQTINHDLRRSARCIWRNHNTAKPRASIVVCLYGKPEFMFLQVSSLFRCLRFFEYELIYVCNSPELLETLLKIAASCEAVYDAHMTIIGLSGNAGFGGANNIAAGYANSDRLLFMNPDVFPCAPTWIQMHEDTIHGLPEEQSRLFGSRLFYADGSLMHAGMYFETDMGVSLHGDRVRQRDLVRVEHYGKGAPPSAARFAGSLLVPAVSGAFISIERHVFEDLNGFSDEVVYGHYEDADLCLRAMQHGVSSWVHDIPMWHLEGKGSIRLPHHEGASLVNRWLFSQKWNTLLQSGWIGPDAPALQAFANPHPSGKRSTETRDRAAE